MVTIERERYLYFVREQSSIDKKSQNFDGMPGT